MDALISASIKINGACFRVRSSLAAAIVVMNGKYTWLQRLLPILEFRKSYNMYTNTSSRDIKHGHKVYPRGLKHGDNVSDDAQQDDEQNKIEDETIRRSRLGKRLTHPPVVWGVVCEMGVVCKRWYARGPFDGLDVMVVVCKMVVDEDGCGM